VGFGGGFFDKLLVRMPRAKKVGLAYAVQISKTPLPIESHDIHMDKIITEKEIIAPA
jgi:5-formyltetrahydrofolate cyclo-ligase